jgi:hypothetical protein
MPNPGYENDKDKEVFAGIGDLLSGKTTIAHVVQGLVPLKKAPNAVIFIESNEFLEGPTLHDPQYEIVRDFFELLCPVCNDIARIHSVNDVPRDKQILFEYDICPKCKFEKNLHADDFTSDKFRDKN